MSNSIRTTCIILTNLELLILIIFLYICVTILCHLETVGTFRPSVNCELHAVVRVAWVNVISTSFQTLVGSIAPRDCQLKSPLSKASNGPFGNRIWTENSQ